SRSWHAFAGAVRGSRAQTTVIDIVAGPRPPAVAVIVAVAPALPAAALTVARISVPSATTVVGETVMPGSPLTVRVAWSTTDETSTNRISSEVPASNSSEPSQANSVSGAGSPMMVWNVTGSESVLSCGFPSSYARAN